MTHPGLRRPAARMLTDDSCRAVVYNTMPSTLPLAWRTVECCLMKLGQACRYQSDGVSKADSLYL